MKNHLTKKIPGLDRFASELYWTLKVRAPILLKPFYKGEDSEYLQTHEASITLTKAG